MSEERPDFFRIAIEEARQPVTLIFDEQGRASVGRVEEDDADDE